MSRWTKVEDCYPAPDVPGSVPRQYLVCFDNVLDVVAIATFCSISGCFISKDPRVAIFDKATHWMQIPFPNEFHLKSAEKKVDFG